MDSIEAKIREQLVSLGCNDVTEAVVSSWREFLSSVMPEEFFAVLRPPGFTIASLRFTKPTGDSLKFKVRVNQGGSEAISMERVFLHQGSPPRSTVIHKLFELRDDLQDEGRAATILESHIGHYEASGVKRVELIANISVGGYAFAKYGFKVIEDFANIENLRQQVIDNLSELDNEETAAAKEFFPYLDWDDPYVAQTLAVLNYGKKLLLGTDWEGYLDLEDHVQMELFKRAIALKVADSDL